MTRRRRGLRLTVAATAAALSTACALVLGIDDKPLRPEQAGEGGVDAGEGGADAACAPDPRLGCTCEKHDFCDDFDDDASAPFSRWSSPLGNPFVKAGSTIGLDGGGQSPERATSVVGASDGGSTYAIVLAELDQGALRPGRPFAGVKLSFRLQIEDLALSSKNSGPVDDAGTAYVGAVLRLLDVKPAGAAVLVADNGTYLSVSTDVIGGSGLGGTALLYEGAVLKLAKPPNWIRVEIFIAERDRAVAAGYASCSALPAGPVAAAMLSLPTYQGCVAIPAQFGDLSWAKTPIIGVGAGTFGAGSFRVRHDNVSLDFLE